MCQQQLIIFNSTSGVVEQKTIFRMKMWLIWAARAEEVGLFPACWGAAKKHFPAVGTYSIMCLPFMNLLMACFIGLPLLGDRFSSFNTCPIVAALSVSSTNNFSLKAAMGILDESSWVRL